MNKKILPIIILILTLLLSACSTVSSSRNASSMTATTLPKQDTLLVGILRLEDTDNAITPEQAKELLPMWYVMQDLTESDSAAQEEIDGLANQIEEILTQEQMEAITALNLTRRDMFSLVQGDGSGTNSARTGSTSNTGGMDGPPPDMGGGFPGGDFGGNQNRSPSTSTNSGGTATLQITSIPAALFDLVIKLLQKKAGL